ncbi:MAG: hypothetical protein GY772_19340 [bacterium]|nr:hypothetical protein [bacterium]
MSSQLADANAAPTPGPATPAADADAAADGGNLPPGGDLPWPRHFRIGKRANDFTYWQVDAEVWECKRGNVPDDPNTKLFLTAASLERDTGYKWIAGHAPEGTAPNEVKTTMSPVFASPDNIFEGMGQTYHRWTWWEAGKWATEEWMHFLTHDMGAAAAS